MADSKPPASDEIAPAVPHLPILLLVSCSAAWVVAQLSYNALPQLLDPIKVAFDRSDEVVTRMYGYELFFYGIVALAVAGPLARFSRVFVALLGGSVAVAAGIVSALTDSYSVLVVCRILLGAGGALVGGAGTAAAASSRDPERVYAVVMIASQVVLAFVPALLERLALGPFGLDGGFYGLAIATALLMPLFIWLLPPRPSEHEATTSAWVAILQAPNRAIAVAAMLALLIYETGQGGIWTYLAELGQNSGVDDRLYGDSMAVIQLVALSGSFLAIWIGDRFGSKWPIVLGVGINVAAAVALSYSTSPIQFVILNVLLHRAVGVQLDFENRLLGGSGCLARHLGRPVPGARLDLPATTRAICGGGRARRDRSAAESEGPGTAHGVHSARQPPLSHR